MDDRNNRPFTMEYVLATTFGHMVKSVDISIRKTFERSEEFKDTPQKSTEVFKTLSKLHDMRRDLGDLERQYSKIAKERQNG